MHFLLHCSPFWWHIFGVFWQKRPARMPNCLIIAMVEHMRVKCRFPKDFFCLKRNVKFFEVLPAYAVQFSKEVSSCRLFVGFKIIVRFPRKLNVHPIWVLEERFRLSRIPKQPIGGEGHLFFFFCLWALCFQGCRNANLPVSLFLNLCGEVFAKKKNGGPLSPRQFAKLLHPASTVSSGSRVRNIWPILQYMYICYPESPLWNKKIFWKRSISVFFCFRKIISWKISKMQTGVPLGTHFLTPPPKLSPSQWNWAPGWYR